MCNTTVNHDINDHTAILLVCSGLAARKSLYCQPTQSDDAMTSVDFYILGHTHEQARHQFVCRLVEKVYGEGRKVYIHAPDADTAKRLDDLMWAYKAESFLPHNVIGDPSAQEVEIQIGWQDHPSHHHDVLVNLCSPIPGFFSRFERVLEVVIQDEAVLEQTRQHYKFYKDRGYQVTHRDLRG